MDLTHESFTVERRIAVPPERVWSCWSDKRLKGAWFVESDGPEWETERYELDFRVGGTEGGSFVRRSGEGAGRHENSTHVLDIVPGERVAFAYTMAFNGAVHLASLATVREMFDS